MMSYFEGHQGRLHLTAVVATAVATAVHLLLLNGFSSKMIFYPSLLSHGLKSLSVKVSEPCLSLLMEPALFKVGAVSRTINNNFSEKQGIFTE